MRFLSSLSIRRQLRAIAMLASATAILVAAGAFVAIDLQRQSDERQREVGRIAELISTQVARAAAQNDVAAMRRILDARAPTEGLTAAVVLANDGFEVAKWGSVAGKLPSVPQGQETVVRSVHNGHLAELRRVTSGATSYGWVFVQSQPVDAWARVASLGIVLAGVVVLALLLALGLAENLQRGISRPISELVRTVKRVSQKSGYSARAAACGDGELGRLVEGFNEMLAQIERRDRLVTEAKESAEAATRAKSDFLATMSHEIRTPLNAIAGVAQLLSDSSLEDGQRNDVATILNSAESLGRLIEDILDFSKVEAGRLELESRAFRPRETCEVVAELLSRRVEAKGIELVIDMPHSFPEELRGDEPRLRQILTNLVSNAIKFTSQGSVVVAARVLRERGQEIDLRFEIRDSGIGIPPERRKQLFDPFKQADSSTTRQYGGTGLGLAISRRLVELFGGKIGVESEEGRGSCFWFEVECKQVSRLGDSICPDGLSGKRALVCESHRSSRRTIVNMLEGVGVEVEAFSDREQALAAVRKSRLNEAPDFMIIGERVSDRIAHNLAERVRSLPALSSMRIVLAAYPARCDELRSLGFAHTWCVPKPMRRAHLLRALVEAPAAEPVPDESPGAGPTAPERAQRVLLAEDNVVNQMVAIRMLKKLGYEVELAHNGLEAVEAAVEREFDAILMDCQMPEMDGYEATTEIRRRLGSERHIPIIALTANAMRGDRERCMAAGMDDHVAKPTKPAQLKEVLARWIEGVTVAD